MEEVFAVLEAYAVVYPRAVVVHVEDAAAAARAVVASLGLEVVADEAVLALALQLLRHESPKARHAAGVIPHNRAVGPQRHRIESCYEVKPRSRVAVLHDKVFVD